MLNLDPAKLFVILVVALIVLGPERLPCVARQLGAAWRELTRVRDQVTEEVRSSLPDIDIPRVPYRSGAVSRFLSDLGAPQSSSSPAPESSVASGHSEDQAGSGARIEAQERLINYVSPDEGVPGLDDPSMN